MMARLLKSLLIIIALLPLAARANNLRVWEKAHALYRQKNYDSALFYYQKAATLYPGNADVCYNLGNTYYRLHRMGPAVLYYKKALLHNPSFREAKDNLLLAQARAGSRPAADNDIFFIRWWNAATDASRSTAWSIAALAFFLGLPALAYLRTVKSRKEIKPQLLIAAGALCAVCLIAAFVSARHAMMKDTAVVLTPDARITMAGRSFPVAEGTVVQLTDSNHRQWLVSLPDGRNGWMNQEQLGRIN